MHYTHARRAYFTRKVTSPDELDIATTRPRRSQIYHLISFPVPVPALVLVPVPAPCFRLGGKVDEQYKSDKTQTQTQT